ncbi:MULTISPECIES: hypothetical protein [unclassified Hyphomicrobium]|uniref:hypothetical protein n=1 Tax=unclassified Hyphomicrobium TaxID=2619925 RepID=UPI000213F7D0|nr:MULTISPECIES: hypothetical protein [unclassified Hyphomicrobium]CCB63300.1 conserved membrane protein of unknown function [Hyphomicrobium sp. MC1]
MNRKGAERGGEAGSLRLYADARAEADTPQKPPRDWKRAILIVGLGALSWVATYVGMLELIEANMGDLPIVHRVIVGFSVAMLMTMIVWLLDQLFRPHPFVTKLSYAGGYIFLSLISIGFGFGFYWKVLESRGEATRSAESAVSEVQNALHGAETRLEQLQATLTQLTQVSTEKAQLEQTKGTSCPNSKPGDGPRRKMREDDAQRFSFASDFVKGRIGAVKTDMEALNGDLTKIVSADSSTFDPKTGTRNEFMRALGRKLDLTATGFNAFRTDPQLRQIRSDLADRAERTTFSDGRNGTVTCPDPQLQMALHGVVKAIDQLPELQKPEIATVEGSEATIEAFRRLTTTFYGLLSFKMPPSADQLRELQKKAIQSVENPAEMRNADDRAAGLSKRDYVPLAVALFVDLCLFLVSMGKRPGGRLDGLVPKMQAAERGPVIEILSRFNDIHRDKQIRENFELFRHVVFDMNGDYYVAVPLDAPPRLNPAERENLRVEAQLLANLFASFEREKIFKRTLLPTTGSVQKRLARQGSKFANSDSFRVYKFTNGAWSDIILGAVMGAARRAERNELRRNDFDEHDAAPSSPVPSTPSPETKHTPNAAQQIETDAFEPDEPAPRPKFDADIRGARPNGAIDPEHAARFGPYAGIYRPEPEFSPPQAPRVRRPVAKPEPEADVTVKAANSNTSRATPSEPPPLPEPRPATVVTIPRSVEPRASVTLQRETATFSVPVSEAVMPDSLKAAMRAFDAQRHVISADADDEQPVGPTPQNHGRIVAFHAEDQLSDDDRAFIRRIAPPAAE